MIQTETVRRACLFAGASVGGLVCFVATFYRIAEGERLNEPSWLTSIAFGSLTFSALLFATMLALHPKGEKRRIGLPIVLTVFGGVVFAYGQFFLTLNVFGS